MTKYSEVNKKETILENVSFVSTKKDQKTFSISKRRGTLILGLLLLSSIVGYVGLMIGFRRIERLEMENFEEVLKVVSETKYEDINNESTRNATVKDLAEHPRVRTKRSSTVRNLYCPTGGTKSLPLYDHEIAAGHDTVMRRFDEHCQCQHGATCRKWHRNSNRFDCSSPISSVLENHYYVKSACYIHDMCYQTGRSKSSCDNEFKHNFNQLCYESPLGYAIGTAAGAVATGAAAGLGIGIGATVAACSAPFINIVTCPIALATAPTSVGTGVALGVATGTTWTNCPAMAEWAYLAVRDHGYTHGYLCQSQRNDTRCS